MISVRTRICLFFALDVLKCISTKEDIKFLNLIVVFFSSFTKLWTDSQTYGRIPEYLFVLFHMYLNAHPQKKLLYPFRMFYKHANSHYIKAFWCTYKIVQCSTNKIAYGQKSISLATQLEVFQVMNCHFYKGGGGQWSEIYYGTHLSHSLA